VRGLAAAEVARGMLADRGGPVVVLAGRVITAETLSSRRVGSGHGFTTWSSFFRGDTQRLPPDAGNAHGAYRSAGGTTTADLPGASTALIVDGLFGIGSGARRRSSTPS
jgi:hypothetical protein